MERFYTGQPGTAPEVSGRRSHYEGWGVKRGGSRTWKGVRPQGLRREERVHGPYLVVHVELDVLRQGADIAARADVVIHHSGDGGVIESLWDPLELHGRHLPSLRLLRLLRLLLPKAPASLRSELLSGPGGFRGAAAAAAATRAHGRRARPPWLLPAELRAAGAGPRGRARQRNGASSAEASHSGSASTPGSVPAPSSAGAGLRARGVMTSAHADAPEGRNAAGERLGKERAVIPPTGNRVFPWGPGLGGWGGTVFRWDELWQVLPAAAESPASSLLSASPSSGVLRTLSRCRRKFGCTICQSTEDRAFRELTWLWKQSLRLPFLNRVRNLRPRTRMKGRLALCNHSHCLNFTVSFSWWNLPEQKTTHRKQKRTT